MIDDPVQTAQLMAKLSAALPLPAIATARLLTALEEQAPDLDLPPQCRITDIHYAGDDGGILCKLDFGSEATQQAFFVSITHLTFDPRLPLAREIAAYQKHRNKRLRRESRLSRHR